MPDTKLTFKSVIWQGLKNTMEKNKTRKNEGKYIMLDSVDRKGFIDKVPF